MERREERECEDGRKGGKDVRKKRRKGGREEGRKGGRKEAAFAHHYDTYKKRGNLTHF